MNRIHDEEQLSFVPAPPDAHALERRSRVGSWWRGYCSCGWQSKIVPDRWRVDDQHRRHVRWESTPLDAREPRP